MRGKLKRKKGGDNLMRKPQWRRRAAGAAIAALALLPLSCGRRGEPSSLSRFPADLAGRGLEPAGVYADGWISQNASVNLYQPEGDQLIVVRGMTPKIAREDFRTDLELRVDGETVAKRPLGLGEFTLEARVPSHPGKRRIGLVFSASQQLPAGDGRTVGALLRFAGFEPLPARKLGAGDEIVERGSGVRLGAAGWHQLETFQNETFRWVSNDARIAVYGAGRGGRRLALTLQSGPGLEGRPFILRVLDGEGRQVDAAEVVGRKKVDLFLPLEAGRESDFRLHVEGGGKPSPNKDPRIMNFRVFLIDGY